MYRNDLINLIEEQKNNETLDLSIKGITENDLENILEYLKDFSNIDLSGNMLKYLPSNFCNLTHLKKLNLASNYFKNFPLALISLTNLETLDLRGNSLSLIPEDLKSLINLKSFFLKDNPLKIIPKVIFSLTNLKELGLVNTRLSVIPEEISQLNKLKSLWLGKNRIKKLPTELLQLDNLEMITLDENPLPIPQDILEQKQARIIFDYYRKYENDLLDYAYESKIVIIGESQAGKTSLLNRLIYDKYYENEVKTENINIDNWPIHLNDKFINVNILDFGGQDILYSLHKHFLTDNCLYIIVWDARNENQSKKIQYWLKIIKQVSANPNVLLVMNKVEEHNTLINKIELKKIIDHIEFYNVSCKMDWNIEKLRQDIKNIFEKNNDLVFKYNREFSNLKKHLKEINKPYLTTEEFGILVNNFFGKQVDRNEVLNVFKAIGKVWTYDYWRLDKYIFLNVNWFIDGLYAIINWVSKNKLDGSFTGKDLQMIFLDTTNKYTDDIMIFFIDFLQIFKVIFEANDKYWFPNLLPFYDQDIELIVSEDHLKCKVNINNMVEELFYNLLVKYSTKTFTKKLYRDLIEYSNEKNRMFIYFSPKKRMYIYLAKKTDVYDFLSTLRTEIMELTATTVDFNILLPDETQVSIFYLKKLQEFGHEMYLSSKFTQYDINELLEKIEYPKLRTAKESEKNVSFIFDTVNRDVIVK